MDLAKWWEKFQAPDLDPVHQNDPGPGVGVDLVLVVGGLDPLLPGAVLLLQRDPGLVPRVQRYRIDP